MKHLATTLVTLALAVLLAGTYFGGAALADDEGREYGPGRGYGPGWGMGPGMMGGGMMGGGMGWGGGFGHGPGMMGGGMMGPHMGWVLAQLSQEQREQLRAHHFAMHRQMIAKGAELAQARLTLAEAMQTFPIDRNKALDAFNKLNDAQRGLFELRLTAMAQAQQIVGKELWEQMHSGFGPGPGMGPGMMGPGAGHMGPRR